MGTNDSDFGSNVDTVGVYDVGFGDRGDTAGIRDGDLGTVGMQHLSGGDITVVSGTEVPQRGGARVASGIEGTFREVRWWLQG